MLFQCWSYIVIDIGPALSQHWPIAKISICGAQGVADKLSNALTKQSKETTPANTVSYEPRGTGFEYPT